MATSPERIAIPDLEKKLAGKSKPFVVDVRKPAEIADSGAIPGAVHRIAHASRAAWLGLAYLILVTSVIAYLIWYWALAHLPAARVAIFSNLQPLATAVLAHLFLGEHVTPQFVGGSLVVISGVILAQLRAPRTAAEVPPEPA